MCLSPLKNVGEVPISDKVTDIRAFKIYENGLFKNEFILKKISFFKKHHWNMLKQT